MEVDNVFVLLEVKRMWRIGQRAPSAWRVVIKSESERGNKSLWRQCSESINFTSGGDDIRSWWDSGNECLFGRRYFRCMRGLKWRNLMIGCRWLRGATVLSTLSLSGDCYETIGVHRRWNWIWTLGWQRENRKNCGCRCAQSLVEALNVRKNFVV